MRFNQLLQVGLITTSLALSLSISAKSAQDTPGIAAKEAALAVSTQASTSAFDQQFSESTQLLRELGQKGYLISNVNFRLQNFKSSFKGRYREAAPNEATANPTQGTCSFVRTLTEQGQDVYLGETDEVKAITTPRNEEEKKLARDFLTLHEAAHCDIALYHQVIVLPDNPQLAQNAQFYFRYLKTFQGKMSFYDLLNENFADASAAIELIKLRGATPSVLHVLNNMVLERQDRELYGLQRDVVSDHNTHLSILEVLKPHSIEKIKALDTPKDLRDMALEIANQSTLRLLSEHSQFIKDSLNEGLLLNTAITYATSRVSNYNEAQQAYAQNSERGSNNSNNNRPSTTSTGAAAKELSATNPMDMEAASTNVGATGVRPQPENFLDNKNSFILRSATRISNSLLQSELFKDYRLNQELTKEQQDFLRTVLDQTFSTRNTNTAAVMETVLYHQTTYNFIQYLNTWKLKNSATIPSNLASPAFPVYDGPSFKAQNVQDLIAQYKERQKYFGLPANNLVAAPDDGDSLEAKISKQRQTQVVSPQRTTKEKQSKSIAYK